VIAAGISEAQRRFCRIRGHRDLDRLLHAIEHHEEAKTLAHQKRVA
jgi:hypothetical protein